MGALGRIYVIFFVVGAFIFGCFSILGSIIIGNITQLGTCIVTCFGFIAVILMLNGIAAEIQKCQNSVAPSRKGEGEEKKED